MVKIVLLADGEMTSAVIQVVGTIGLMHDDIICLKVTAKPHLHEMFPESLPPFCCFHEVILCISVPWEFVLKICKSAL